jgi:hypothetical protein
MTVSAFLSPALLEYSIRTTMQVNILKRAEPVFKIIRENIPIVRFYGQGSLPLPFPLESPKNYSLKLKLGSKKFVIQCALDVHIKFY